MGLVLTAIAVEMILAGLKRYFFEPLWNPERGEHTPTRKTRGP